MMEVTRCTFTDNQSYEGGALFGGGTFLVGKVAVDAKAAPPPPTPLRLTLEGVAMSAGSRIAVLRSQGNNQLLTLGEGMTHEGWTLESIEADRASFRRGGQVTELPLSPDPAQRGRR